jgi:carbon-monoxide dehydrogenase small subunit
MTTLRITLNGRLREFDVNDNALLSDVLRRNAGLTGTHRGCDTAQCGACTVHMDGRAVKSCNLLALQAAGKAITTIEGLATHTGELHPMQRAFRECHGLHCGYCTPGMVMSAVDILRCHPQADEHLIREQLDGNLCRCTGYDNILKAVLMAQRELLAQREPIAPRDGTN